MNKPELLMPAGSLDVLKTAVRYGADAVYMAGPGFGARQNAGNSTWWNRNRLDIAGEMKYIDGNEEMGP